MPHLLGLARGRSHSDTAIVRREKGRRLTDLSQKVVSGKTTASSMIAGHGSGPRQRGKTRGWPTVSQSHTSGNAWLNIVVTISVFVREQRNERKNSTGFRVNRIHFFNMSGQHFTTSLRRTVKFSVLVETRKEAQNYSSVLSPISLIFIFYASGATQWFYTAYKKQPSWDIHTHARAQVHTHPLSRKYLAIR